MTARTTTYKMEMIVREEKSRLVIDGQIKVCGLTEEAGYGPGCAADAALWRQTR